MPTLSFNVTSWDWWSASVSIPYTLSYNASTNKTTVTFSACTLSYAGANHYGTNTTTTLTVKAGDNTSSSSTTSFTTGGTSAPSGETYTGTPSPVSITVQHSAGPGAKTVTVVAETTIHVAPRGTSGNIQPDYYYISGSGSRTDTSHTIPYASIIASCSSSVQANSNIALTMTRYSSSYYHKATFKVGGTTLATSSAFATSLSYTAARSWFNGYPSASSLTVTISVQTYTNSSATTAVGSPVTATVTVYADSGMSPVIGGGFASAAAYNTGTAASGISGYVQGYSKCRLTLTKSGLTLANNATAASYKVVCQNYTGTKSSPGATETFTTNTLTGSSAIAITITVTDSRGLTASTTLTVTPMAYANPTLSGISIFRCNSGGVVDADGTYYSAKATASCSSLGGQNSVTLTVKYKAVVDPNYGPETTLTSGTASVLGSNLLDPDISYIAMLTATDSLGNFSTATVTMPNRKWAMKFRPNGEGVGFGKAPEHSKALEVPSDWEMYFGTEPFKEHAQKLYDSVGIEIANGDDLNDYTTPGVYCSPSGTVTASLSNCPVTGWNFRLDVRLTSGGGLLTQTITSSGYVDIYVRACHGGAWTAWARLFNTVTDSYLSNIGEMVATAPSGVNVTSGADTQVASIQLTAGRWVINTGARFASNATGYRRAYVQVGTAGVGVIENGACQAINGTYTWVHVDESIAIAETTTVKLYAYQNSGSTLQTYGRIYAIRIK